jgi:hypothetical protein
VSSLGPSASALGPFFGSRLPCDRKDLVAAQHNASSEKKQRSDDFASAAGALIVLQRHISVPPMPNGAKPRAG